MGALPRLGQQFCSLKASRGWGVCLLPMYMTEGLALEAGDSDTSRTEVCHATKLGAKLSCRRLENTKLCHKARAVNWTSAQARFNFAPSIAATVEVEVL